MLEALRRYSDQGGLYSLFRGVKGNQPVLRIMIDDSAEFTASHRISNSWVDGTSPHW